MKVYQLKMILGKVTHYDKSGKLKNQVITTKLDEFELANMLENNNWKNVGACEVECVGAIDYTQKTQVKKAVIIPDIERMNEINSIIRNGVKAAKKPKTMTQQLMDQAEVMEVMSHRIKELEMIKPAVTSTKRLAIEEKANELNIKFRSTIGDDSLLAKIVAIDPEYKIE